MNHKTKYAYQELGDTPGAKGQWHGEGAEITHPSGVKYKRINGNWVVQEQPGKGEQ